MKSLPKILAISLGVLHFHFAPAQTVKENFSNLLTNYYQRPDKNLLEKTLKVSNDPSTEYQQIKPMFTGFFGALFSKDTVTRNEFSQNLNRIENKEIRMLLSFLCDANIDSLYESMPVGPGYNDIYWASFFATGNVAFIDKIIANIPFVEERENRMIYFAGATAFWSLCSNARQHPKVREHLLTVKVHKKAIKEILKREPGEYKAEMLDVIREEMKKGRWKESWED